MATHTLKNDMFNLVINERGGCIDCFQYRGKKPFDILRLRTELGNGSAGESGMFPMIPLVNRVRANHFNWRGKQVVLPINPQVDKGFFLHGDGWLSQWKLSQENQTDGWIELELASSIDGVCHYYAVQRFHLIQNRLVVTMTLANQGTEDFPFGLGFHPFFSCLPDTKVTFPAFGVWLEDHCYLPCSYTTNIPPVFNFNKSKRIPEDWINNGYSMGEPGVVATIQHSNGLVITLTSPCEYLQVFKPKGQSNFLCLEPQSQAVDAHSYLPTSSDDSATSNMGLVVLSPNQSMQIQMSIQVRK
ncbi:aldose 1-epimerase [Vibrio parahaemolyticus]